MRRPDNTGISWTYSTPGQFRVSASDESDSADTRASSYNFYICITYMDSTIVI